MSDHPAPRLVAAATLVLALAGCASGVAGTPSPSASPIVPTPAPTALPTGTPTSTATPAASATSKPTPSPSASPEPPKPSGLAFHWTDINESCDPGPGASCAIPERVVTVSWEAPRTKDIEIRLYGVTRCFGTDARGAVIDGYCLREHTALPSSTLTLLARAPASEGTITVWMRPAEVLAATYRDVNVHSFVVAAYDASGAHSIFAIAGTAEYCESAEVPCPGDEPNPAAWPTVHWGGVTMTAETDDSTVPLSFYVTVTGLEPGAKVRLSAVGMYDLGWVCAEIEPTSELGVAYAGGTGGIAADRAEAVANTSGVAALWLDLAPVSPASCPPGSKPPPSSGDGTWTGLTIVDLDRGLTLRPPSSAWTM